MGIFSEMAKKKASEIAPPPLLPAGHYTLQVRAKPEQSDIGENDAYGRLNFQFIVVEPHDDVDPDELEEYGNVVGAVTSKSIIWPNDEAEKTQIKQAEYNISRVLTNLRVPGFESGEISIEEALLECVGLQLIGEVIHRQNKKDPEAPPMAEVGRTAPVD